MFANTYNTNIKPSKSSNGNDGNNGDDIKVQIRGDRTEPLSTDEIRAKVRSTGLTAGQVNKVVQKTEEWARSASKDGEIDYRDLNEQIEKNVSNEDPGAAAKFAITHDED